MSLVSSGDKLPRCVPHPHFQGNQRDKNTSIFLTLAAEEHRPGRLDSRRLYTLFKFSLFCLYQERQIYMNSIRTCSASLKKYYSIGALRKQEDLHIHQTSPDPAGFLSLISHLPALIIEDHGEQRGAILLNVVNSLYEHRTSHAELLNQKKLFTPVL